MTKNILTEALYVLLQNVRNTVARSTSSLCDYFSIFSRIPWCKAKRAYDTTSRRYASSHEADSWM